MRGRLAYLPQALAFHLRRHGRATFLVVLGGASGCGVLGWLGRDSAGHPYLGAPMLAGVVVLALMGTGGAVARETATGRAALFAFAAGGRLPWLAWDVVLRVCAVLLTTGAAVAACAVAAGWTAGPPAGLALVEALPFLALVALCLAATGYGWSALSERFDGLLAAIYVFPVSVGVVAVAAVEDGWSPWLWLCFPVDALVSRAPASRLPSELLPGPPADVRIALFVAGWLGIGLLLGRLRPGRNG
jgi:hypothetical protein